MLIYRKDLFQEKPRPSRGFFISYLCRMRTLALIVLFLTGLHLHAQRTFGTGIIAGINGCQIHGDNFSGFDQIGFVAGGFVYTNPDGTWQTQFGIQYSRKGSRHLVPRHLGGYEDFEIRLNYVDVPFIVRYNAKKIFFDFGLSFGVMFKVRTFDANGETVPQDFRRFEVFALVNGIGYNVSDRFFIELTTHNSLIPIKRFDLPYDPRLFPRIFNRGMYNNLLGVMFGYRFGGGSGE